MKHITLTNYSHFVHGNKENSTILHVQMEMKEPIEEIALIRAAEQTMKRYPAFAMRLVWTSDGFEYEENKRPAPVFSLQEGKQYHLGSEETNGYLFRISFRDNAIVLSLHHSITDGRGVMEFVKTLLYYYLKETGVTVNPEGIVRTNEIPYDAEAELEETAERFADCSIPEEPAGDIGKIVPFALPETCWDEAGNYSCRSFKVSCSSKDAKAAAQRAGTAVSAWLTAVVAKALEKTYDTADKLMLAVVTANIRPFAQSDTMFNFSGYVTLGIPSQLRTAPFAVEAQQIEAQLRNGNTPEAAVKTIRKKRREVQEYRKMSFEEVFDSEERKMAEKKKNRQAMAFLLTNVGVLKLPKDIYAHLITVDLSLPSFETPVNFSTLTTGDLLTIGATMCFDNPAIAENIQAVMKEQGVSSRITDLGIMTYDGIYPDSAATAK